MNKTITVKDIAQICGVSLGTVDRALNDRPGIKEETKRMILETVQKYGYQKNRQAISLASGKSGIIGVLVFNLNSEYFAQLITSIEKSVRDAGCTPVFLFTGIRQEKERDCVKSLLSMNVDGIITCSCLAEDSCYLDLQSRGIPVVSVGNKLGEAIPYVGIDDCKAMYDAAKAILAKGYRRLIYISPVLEKRNTENIGAQGERYAGFCKAISEAPDTEVAVIDRYENFEQSILETVEKSTKPTAILCASDNYTICCLRLLRNRLKPKGNLGLHGFDQNLTLQQLHPELASVEYPTDEIGKAAVKLLLSAGKSDIIFNHKIVQGESL